jgi:hypothetical protein
MLVAWRGLDRSAPLAKDTILHVAETLQLKMDDALRAAIADVQQLAASAHSIVYAISATAADMTKNSADLDFWLQSRAMRVKGQLLNQRRCTCSSGSWEPPSAEASSRRAPSSRATAAAGTTLGLLGLRCRYLYATAQGANSFAVPSLAVL